LFDDDSADVEAVIVAVNRRVGRGSGGAFSRDEAVKALKRMDTANQIM
jgi:DNA replication licensing factor MCM3